MKIKDKNYTEESDPKTSGIKSQDIKWLYYV